MVQKRYNTKLPQNLIFCIKFCPFDQNSCAMDGYQYIDYHQYIDLKFSSQKSGESSLGNFRTNVVACGSSVPNIIFGYSLI